MKPPVLETERLILRPLRMEDAEAHHHYFNNWEIVKHLAAGVPWPYPENGSIKFLEFVLQPDNPSYFWAITKKDRFICDEMIGLIELRPHKAERQRGFWIGLPFQNQGLMSEAVTATNDFWFNELNQPYMSMSNALNNVASNKIKEKAGARLVNTIEAPYMDSSYTHAQLWKTTAEEWREFRNQA